MPKALSLAHNSFAVFALFAIISLSVITTISLSPVVFRDQARVAGANTQNPQILSNFIPLTISDLNNPSQQYTSQLVQYTQGQYGYSATFMPYTQGIYKYEFVSVDNQNSAPIYLKISAAVPQEVQTSLNISVSDGTTEYRVHDVNSSGRIVEFEISTNTTTKFGVSYELTQSIAFPFNVSLSLEY